MPPAVVHERAVVLGACLPLTLLLTWLLTAASPRGAATYVSARFSYADGSLFDNSPLTYGTDYAVAAWMAWLAYRVRASGGPRSAGPRRRVGRLLCAYALQLFLGGVAHQRHDGTAASLSGAGFRALWTAVVGLVVSASADVVAVANAVAAAAPPAAGAPLAALAARVRVGDRTARSFANALAALAALGAFSFSRPAADVFAAGVTQTPATAYLFLALAARPSGASAVAFVGFALPVPLVFAYPYVLGTARLGAINAALHLWLLAAWTCQGLGIAALCDALDSDAPAGKRDS
jgi:hypothetical protein